MGAAPAPAGSIEDDAVFLDDLAPVLAVGFQLGFQRLRAAGFLGLPVSHEQLAKTLG